MENENWLAGVLSDAKEKRWCRRINCTTCGCLKFRGTVFGAAMERIGVNHGSGGQSHRDFRRRLAALSPEEDSAVCAEVVRALRALGEADSLDTAALEVIVVDISRGLVGPVLAELDGTPAGEVLRRRETEHEAWVDHKRKVARQHEARTLREQEASEIRRAARAREVEGHAQRKVANDKRMRELLETLRAMDQQQRLELLCAVDIDVPLGIVPDDLVPVTAEAKALTGPQKSRLVLRIGKRKGAWAELQRQLQG